MEYKFNYGTRFENDNFLAMRQALRHKSYPFISSTLPLFELKTTQFLV